MSLSESEIEQLVDEWTGTLLKNRAWGMNELLTMQFFILQNLRQINRKLSDWLWLMQGKEKI